MLWVLIRGEAILMSTNNIGFYEDLTKIIFELSSNTHLISSAEITQKLEMVHLQVVGADYLFIINIQHFK